MMQNGKHFTVAAPHASAQKHVRRKGIGNLACLLVVFPALSLLLLLQHRKCPAPVPSPTVIQQLELPSPVIDNDVQQSLQPVRVFVGVLSRSNNTIVRQAIRETWGSDKRLSFVKFMVLRPKSKRAFRALREEAVKHEDIIVVSAKVENYFNITYSTLELFRSAAVLGSQITHVLKTDEDCFLRVDPLLEALRKAPQQWMYGGHPLGYTDTVSRNPKDPNRIYVPYSNWPSDSPLPIYAWGHGGVLTMDLVKHIAAGAAHLAMDAENLLVLEDASTGVWVKYIADEQHQKINYVHLPFDRTVCRPTDALTHLEKWLWASLADSHRCLYNGSCADKCTGESKTPPPAITNQANTNTNSLQAARIKTATTATPSTADHIATTSTAKVAAPNLAKAAVKTPVSSINTNARAKTSLKAAAHTHSSSNPRTHTHSTGQRASSSHRKITHKASTSSHKTSSHKSTSSSSSSHLKSSSHSGNTNSHRQQHGASGQHLSSSSRSHSTSTTRSRSSSSLPARQHRKAISSTRSNTEMV